LSCVRPRPARPNLVEHEDAGDLREVELREQLLGRLDVLSSPTDRWRRPRAAAVVRVGGLLEGRAERGEEILRQIADEADGVGDHHLALLGEAQAPRASGSSVAKSLSSVSTSAPVSVFSSVLLPALV
jgi:hypothetical protein